MAKGESREAQKKGGQEGKRKRTTPLKSGKLQWEQGLNDERRFLELEKLLAKLDEAVKKAKPLMSEEEALKELYELRRQRAARLLGR